MYINKIDGIGFNNDVSPIPPNNKPKNTEFQYQIDSSALNFGSTNGRSLLIKTKPVITDNDIKDLKNNLKIQKKYTDSEIDQLIELYKKNPDTIKKYIGVLNHGSPNVQMFIDFYNEVEQKPHLFDFFNQLLNTEKVQNGKKQCCFEFQQIYCLIKCYDEVDEDFTQKLADEIKTNNNNKECYFYPLLESLKTSGIKKEDLTKYVTPENIEAIGTEFFNAYIELKDNFKPIIHRDKDIDTITNLALMKTFNKKTYNNLYSNSYKFSVIKQHGLDLVENITFNENKEFDDGLNCLLNTKHQEVENIVNSDPTFNNINKDVLLKILNNYLGDSPLDQFNLVNGLKNAKNKDFLKNIINGFIYDTIEDLEQKEKTGSTNINFYQSKKSISDIVLFAATNPDIVRKTLFITSNSTSDPNATKNIIKAFANTKLPEEKTDYIIDICREKLTNEKENFDINLIPKYIKYLELAGGDINKFNNFIQKNLDRNRLDYYNLLEIAICEPEKFDRIMSTNIWGLTNHLLISPRIDYFKDLNKASDFTPQMYQDLEKVNKGESIVPEFSSTDEAFSNTKIGDVAEINGQMYINEGKKLYKWKMTKENYLKLFPPVERFATQQGHLANCYFISALAKSMSNPIARVNLYKSFEQDGNDTIVTIKGYNGYGDSHRFINNNIDNGYDKHLIGCDGLQMYEHTYKLCSLRENYMDTTPEQKPEDMDLDTLANRLRSGYFHTVMSEINDLDNLGLADKNNVIGANYQQLIDIDSLNEIPDDIHKASCKIINVTPQKIETFLDKFANKDEYCIGFSSVDHDSEQIEKKLNPEYNIISNHAYTINGYDKKENIVTISNPHNCGIETKIPLNELNKHICFLYLCGLS